MKPIISILISFYVCQISAQSINLPYSNSFNTSQEVSEWTHYSLTGVDDWESGIPLNFGNYTSDAFVTNLTSNCAISSIRCLETPDFNLVNNSTNQILSFNQRRSGSSCNYILEYSLNSGATWQLLDNATMPKNNWQTISGWTGNISGVSQKSSIRINFLQGNSSVRFRFKFSSAVNQSRGWLIDDFSIQDEFINIKTLAGPEITNVTTYFTQFTVKNSFIYTHPYNTLSTLKNAFYLSTDSIYDNLDIYLGNVNFMTSSSFPNWTNTFNLPQGLTAGNYYVVTRVDTLNNLIENIETDNISYTLLKLQEPLLTNYSDDFETVTDNWRKIDYPNDTTWLLGDPNSWHLENAHSGVNSWYSWNEVYNNPVPQDIESPYLNLTGTDSNSICFWYKHSGIPSSGYEFSLKLPLLMGATIGTPSFSSFQFYQIRLPRRYGWDCYCQDITAWDNQKSTKFRIEAYGNVSSQSLNQAAIDDIYIGTKKADVSIENETPNRFTSAQNTTYDLVYTIYNSGLKTLPITTTKFYWSLDSILDNSDVLLSSVSEPSIADTSFLVKTLGLTKPTLTPGVYYILWITDANNIVDEMRENNNAGFMQISQQNSVQLPYFNDFETEVEEWHHLSTLGIDNWEWELASNTTFSTAISGLKAFSTSANGDTASSHSRSHLFSPIFNLGELVNPVLEFDLKAIYYDLQIQYPYANMGNLMYSIDGGASWKILTPQNQSNKRMYNRYEYFSQIGIDAFSFNGTGIYYGDLFYGKYLPILLDLYSYQTRKYDDNTRYIVDLSFLAGQTVKFMYVYANENSPMQGLQIDNFHIRESFKDLFIPTDKKIMSSSFDKKIQTFFEIKNNGNYTSPLSILKMYCSVDSLLDVSDTNFLTKNIHVLHPHEKALVVVDSDVPLNYGTYNYLICELDAGNAISESNELNNIHVFKFEMDSCSNYNFPILYDFQEKYIDGWSWNHDSSGLYNGHTFRTQKVISEPVISANDGEWFLDPIDSPGYGTSLSMYPTFFIYSPTFDFRGRSNLRISFDIKVITGFDYVEGANLSYSTDGGLTWILLDSQDTASINWYNKPTLSELQGEPGWGEAANWRHCEFNTSFLSGQSNVKFRFKYKGKYQAAVATPKGFRMDNFMIDGISNDLLTENNNTTLNATLANQTVNVNYLIVNDGILQYGTTKTGFYWSTDTILDNGDSFVGEFNENTIDPYFNGIRSFNVPFPSPVEQLSYSLFHKIDNDEQISEIHEENNIGRTDVLFDLTNVGISEYDNSIVINRIGDQYELLFNEGNEIKVSFLNMQGQVLYSASNEKNSNTLILKPQYLASGIYLVKISCNGKISHRSIFHH